MELYQLKSFVSVAHSGNLTRSADEMNISLSALSSQIKKLEQSLNIRLFTRGPKGRQLTENGRIIYRSASKIIEAANELQSIANGFETQVAGRLNIGINTDPRFLDISDISRRMAQNYPRVSIGFIETQTFETARLLKEGKIDVGFHYGSLEAVFIHSMPLSQATICVAMPEKFAKAHQRSDFTTIAQLPWVWTTHDCPFHMALKSVMDKKQLVLNQVTDAVEENIVRALVKSGTGLALVRKDEALEMVKEGTAVIWEGLELEIPLGIACLQSRNTEPVIARFFEIMKEKYSPETASI